MKENVIIALLCSSAFLQGMGSVFLAYCIKHYDGYRGSGSSSIIASMGMIVLGVLVLISAYGGLR